MGYFRKALGFNDFWLMVFGIPIGSIVMTAILFNDTLTSFTPMFFGRCFLVSMVYVSIYWVVFRLIFVYFRHLFPKTQDVSKRLFLQTGTILLAYMILRIALKATLHEHLHAFSGVGHNPDNQILEPVASLILTFLVLSIYEGASFFNLLNRSILEKEKLQKAHIQSQLQGLKSQVNPHFLFNSLNTLAHLIPEDTDKAVRFVQKLSKTYRYILEIRDEKLISLRDELEFLKAFVFLLEERFGENLKVDIQVEESYFEDKVIPLSLQLLVENAIKHNIISKNKPLWIKIFIDREKYLVVQNNLQLKNQVIKSTKIGLGNIKKRYNFYSEELVEVNVSEKHFTVALPLIHTVKLVS